MSDEQSITVTRNSGDNRYEAHVNGAFAGVVEYFEAGDIIHLTHTEVFDDFRGTDAASTLARESILDATERGKTIVPDCSYIAHFLDKNTVPGARVEAPQN